MQKKVARILIILIGALTAAFWLSAQHDSTAAQQVTPLQAKKATQLPQITLKEFDSAIKAESRPTLLFFYASWCPHCRIQMPQVMKLAERRPEDVNVIYISIDEDPKALVTFLDAEHPDSDFTPYMIAKGEGRKFAHYLQSRNSGFRGGVPYSGLFQPNSRLTNEFLGRTPISVIEAALDK